MYAPRLHLYNEVSLLVTFEGLSMEQAYRQVQALYHQAREIKVVTFKNLVPAYNSLLFVCQNPRELRWLHQYLQGYAWPAAGPEVAPASVEKVIPVCYDLRLGNDLELMEQILHVAARDIIDLHAGKKYHVYMLGFLPGFAYMGQVDQRIAIPRKPSPVATRAGAVGIAGLQTGIYPQDSPGGWHIVGYTPLKMFDLHRTEPAWLQPGDQVTFRPVEADEYESIKALEYADN